MKAQKALHLYIDEEKKKPKSQQGNNYAVFEKYDGWYGYYEDGVIYSRAGRSIPSVQWLAVEIRENYNMKGIRGRLIFEILLRNETEFSILNGILNRKREIAKDAYIKVHDFIPVNNTGRLDPSPSFTERYFKAKRIVHTLRMKEVEIAPVLAVSNKAVHWREVCQKIWDRGGEGIILKQVDAPYEPDKRNANLLKIKEELTLDLLVSGVERGEGKYESTLGKLILRDSEGNPYKVSGMSDEQRDYWWANPDEIIGKVVEVKAMKRLPCGSLREPRFKAVRHDKEVREID